MVRQFSLGVWVANRTIFPLEQTQRYITKKPLGKGLFKVGPLGLEPRLFWTKTRRVASYTMDQFLAIFAEMDTKDKCILSYMQRKM